MWTSVSEEMGSCHIENEDDYPIVINPLSSVAIKHWEKIKVFINNSLEREIIMVTPDYSKAELENIIGVHPNVKIFGGMRVDIRALVEELLK